MAQINMDKVTQIHSTEVRIDLSKLNDIVTELKARYDEIGNRDTHEGRSRFSAYNNIAHFQERISTLSSEDGTVTIDVNGTAKGSSARVYYSPSVTSLAKPFRKCIVPTHDGNKFMFFDLKSAEFFMNCVFCGEEEAVAAYHRGEDIYLQFKDLFPAWCNRETIKTCLISSMYGATPYRVGLQCGISDAKAEGLLRMVAAKIPRMERAKMQRIFDAKRCGYYRCPNGFGSEIIRIAEIDPKKGFQPNLALSAYVQSALGLFMQNLIHQLEPRTRGTVLTVFDSMLIEFSPENEQRLKDYLTKALYPFRAGAFQVGETFYEAAYGKS